MSKSKILFFFSLLSLQMAFSQLTIKITSIPANTPAGATLYFAGSSNNWNPSDSNAKFAAGANNTYTYTFTPAVGTVEYKITRGSWATVEGNAAGEFRPNRTVTYSGTPKTVEITIAGWEGLAGGSNSTAAANVSILNNQFYIPQLNRYRRVWIYLPPDYQNSNKTYPVMYLLDGQNVFDASTSFSGEWAVDEALNAKFAQGDYGCIAVAIDNGGADRLNEYSPWINQQYGGGQGEAFLQFLTETLKPYIDSNYRTNPAPSHTAIVGSSMGGLFAQYALSQRQDVFGKAAVFSPAFWFADNASRDHVLAQGKQEPSRVFYLAGGAEPAYVAADMAAVRNAMLQIGHPAGELNSSVPSDGTHSEWFWKREFPAAYTWLFSGLTATQQPWYSTSTWQISPNPADDYFSVSTPGSERVNITVYSSDGRVHLRKTEISTQTRISMPELKKGIYFVHIEGQDRYAVRKLKVI